MAPSPYTPSDLAAQIESPTWKPTDDPEAMAVFTSNRREFDDVIEAAQGLQDAVRGASARLEARYGKRMLERVMRALDFEPQNQMLALAAVLLELGDD